VHDLTDLGTENKFDLKMTGDLLSPGGRFKTEILEKVLLELEPKQKEQ